MSVRVERWAHGSRSVGHFALVAAHTIRRSVTPESARAGQCVEGAYPASLQSPKPPQGPLVPRETLRRFNLTVIIKDGKVVKDIR